MNAKEFAAELKKYRKNRAYSQRDAALALGCSKRTLQNWEQARAIPHEVGLNALLRLMKESAARQPKPKAVEPQMPEETLATHLL